VTPALPVSVGNSVFEFIAKDRTGNKTQLNVSYTIARKSATQNSGIALTLSETADKVELKWGLIGLTTPDGVKVLFSEASNPKFPDSSSIYEKKNQSASFKKSEFGGGKTYYFKVCRFNKDKNTCDSYSNEVTITIPESDTDEDTPTE